MLRRLSADEVERICYGEGPTREEMSALRGTSLTSCARESGGCGRAVVVSGAEDVDVLLELVDDEGWTFSNRVWRCERCPAYEGPGPQRPVPVADLVAVLDEVLHPLHGHGYGADEDVCLRCGRDWYDDDGRGHLAAQVLRELAQRTGSPVG